MPPTPGIYHIKHFPDNAAFDLSGGDNKSIIVFPFHGLENQQWEIEALGSGFSFKNALSKLWLNIDLSKDTPGPIEAVANEFPVAWQVTEIEQVENGFRITWPGSNMGLDTPSGSFVAGTKISLAHLNHNPLVGAWSFLPVFSPHTTAALRSDKTTTGTTRALIPNRSAGLTTDSESQLQSKSEAQTRLTSTITPQFKSKENVETAVDSNLDPESEPEDDSATTKTTTTIVCESTTKTRTTTTVVTKMSNRKKRGVVAT